MPVVRVSMKDQIYDEIKLRIHSNIYAPGDRINIDNIARELEVSNSPVREAINMLVKDGLLNISNNAGARVIELDESDVADLNQSIYILLIGGYDACEAAGKLVTLESELRKRLDVQRTLLQENVLVEYIRATINYDRAFVDVTENKRLVNMYDSLSDIFYLSVADRFRKNRIDHKDNIEEHACMIDAVCKGNRQELVNVLQWHYHQC